MKLVVNCDLFQGLHRDLSSKKVTLVTPQFFIKNQTLKCIGFDASLQKWRQLPSMTNLFKLYNVYPKDF